MLKLSWLPCLALNAFGNGVKLNSSLVSSLVLAQKGELELGEGLFTESDE